MKYIIFLMPILSFAHSGDFAKQYATKAFTDYSNASSEAVLLRKSINEFLKDTTKKNFAKVKLVWTEARKVYSRTEIYRFYGGPIDGTDGPEGLINAWPLDEVYIDYVRGKANSGIINRKDLYPKINKKLIIELNEKNGEKNISTGWHTIEFLLWGQDFQIRGPGQRPLSDFIVGQGKNAKRRRKYLKIVTDLLVEHLTWVKNQWDPSNIKSYHHSFTSLSKSDALKNAFTSLVSMASDELAIERIFVAYDTQLQEDEHSCFSDTTHFDLLHNFRGIKQIWEVVDKHTDARMLAPAEVKHITLLLADLDKGFVHFPNTFDQAIFNRTDRAKIKLLIDGLQDLGDRFRKVATQLGIKI